MTSNIHDWENEEDEIPITADAGIFSKPNLHENDPLAGDHDDLEDPFEENRPNQTVENEFGGRTRSSSRVKVATATPTKKPVLSNPPPATSISSTNLIPSYINKKAFTAEMDKNIACIIDESIGLFGLDPRGYHPFYLRIYKYIDIGIQNKHIKSFKDIKSHWRKYDRICTERLEKPKAKTTFTGIESPYATYIKTGRVVVNGKEVNLKRNEAEIKKRFLELEKSAKDIVNQWKEGQSKSILGDLTTRLQFFNHCKSITFPADCVKMNKLWHRFLYEYPQLTNTERVEVKRTDAAKDLKKLVHFRKSSFQTIAKSQKSSAADVDIIDLDNEHEDDFQSQIELDLPPMEDTPFDVDDKLMPTSETNPSESENQERKHKTENEMTESNLSAIVKIQIKNTVTCGDSHLRASLKNAKPLINTKVKSKIGAGRLRAKQEQKKRFKLSQLKVTHALNKLKLRRKGSTLVKKQAKLENMLCSGPYFSKVKSSFKMKQSLKKESSPSPSSPVPANVEEGQIFPPPYPTLVVAVEKHEAPPQPASPPLSTLVANDHPDKPATTTTTDHSSIGKTVMDNNATPPDPLTSQNLRKRFVVCNICGEIRSSHKYLDIHKIREHKTEPEACRLQEKGEQKKCICDICGQVIYGRSNFLNHKYSRHSSNKNRKKKQCPICLEEFWMLWPHFQQVHIQGLEGLEKGTKHSSTDNDSDVVEPPLPPPEIPVSNNVKRNPGPIECEICGKQFPSNSSLSRHMEQMHETKGKQFLCQECPKQFKMKDTLDAHIREVHLGKNYRCDICSRVMQSGGKLWKHKVDVHGMSELEPPPGVTLMQCEYCGEKLLRGMLQHILKNHPEQAVIGVSNMKRKWSLSEEARKRKSERNRAAWKEWKTTGKGPAWIGRNVLKKRKEKPRQRSRITDIWTCPTANCGKVLKGNYNFELHLRRGHGSDDKFIAVLEKIQFLKRTPNETWHCVACEENLDYVDEVKVHFALQHQQTVKKIQGLGQTFSATTSEVLYCPHCGKKLDGDQALRDHAENSHPEMCCKCPECEWLVISPAELQEHFMLEHTDPDPLLEWRKHKDNPNGSKDSKMKENKSKVKKKKQETNTKLKRKRPQPTRPSSRRKKRNGSQKFSKCDDLNSESSSESSADSDDDFTRIAQLEPKGASSEHLRRSCRNAKSRYKKATDTTTTLANFTDFKLYQCQVYVKRLSNAEISFYCKSSL